MPPVGEIRAGNKLQQIVRRGGRIVYQMKRCLAELSRIMGRDRGCHAHGTPLRAIGQQVREGGRQHNRLLVFLIVGGAKINRVLIEAVEQQRRDIGQSRLGVAIRSGVIAIDIAEIALPLDQRIALGKILREADHGIIDRLIAVGVVFTDDIADNAGAFLEGLPRIEL